MLMAGIALNEGMTKDHLTAAQVKKIQRSQYSCARLSHSYTITTASKLLVKKTPRLVSADDSTQSRSFCRGKNDQK